MMERSYLAQTAPSKKIGLQVMGSPFTGTTYAGSIFQNNDTELNISADGKNSFAARGTINFAELMGDKEMVMHVGLAGLDNEYAVRASSSSQTTSAADDTTLRATVSSFRSAGRGMSNIFRGQVASQTFCVTAAYSCASEVPLSVSQRSIGLEGIFATGPFKLMGEYSNGRYKGTGDGQTKYDTKTYYLEAGWFITGEKYADSYKGGVFSSFKPKKEFNLDKGDLGAIELAFRAEAFDVDNIDISGPNIGAGRVQGALSSYTRDSNTSNTGVGVSSGAKTYTTGVRWILNPNLVLKANYAYSKFDHAFAPIDVVGAGLIKDEKLLMFRTQFMF
jgi:phosphate-selective porin OprO/OprP